MIDASDGERTAGRPTVEIVGKYRRHRLRVREHPLIKVVPSDRPGYVWVDTYEPVGEG